MLRNFSRNVKSNAQLTILQASLCAFFRIAKACTSRALVKYKNRSCSLVKGNLINSTNASTDRLVATNVFKYLLYKATYEPTCCKYTCADNACNQYNFHGDFSVLGPVHHPVNHNFICRKYAMQ